MANKFMNQGIVPMAIRQAWTKEAEFFFGPLPTPQEQKANREARKAKLRATQQKDR